MFDDIHDSVANTISTGGARFLYTQEAATIVQYVSSMYASHA